MKVLLMALGLIGLSLATSIDGHAQTQKQTGALAGVVTGQEESKTMNNAWVEIKADGE